MSLRALEVTLNDPSSEEPNRTQQTFSLGWSPPAGNPFDLDLDESIAPLGLTFSSMRNST
ncbi:hypothetical protein GCM10020001_050230 [Nonomuraea salmonea]